MMRLVWWITVAACFAFIGANVKSAHAQDGAALDDIDALIKNLDAPVAQEAPVPVAVEAPAAGEEPQAQTKEEAEKTQAAEAPLVPAAVEAPAPVTAEAPAAGEEPQAQTKEEAEKTQVAEAPQVPAAVEAPAPVTAEAPAAVKEAQAAETPKDEAQVAEVPAAQSADPRDSLVSEIMTLEALRRKALDEHGIASLQAGKKALKDGDYEEARSQFELALQYIGDRLETRALRDEAREGVREALYRQAMLLWKKGDRERAVQLARQAHEKGHPQASKLAASIQKEIDNPPEPKKPVQMARMHEKSFRDDREIVQRHLQRARQYYVVGEYDKAREEAEIVLREHPYDLEAISLLDRIADRTYDISSSEFEATRSRMIRDVRDTWKHRRYALDMAQDLTSRSPAQPTGVQLVAGTAMTPEQVVMKKMKDIIVPEITFRQANINDVITFFESSSREYDAPDTPPDKRGVNFVLKQNQSQTAAPQASNDPFAMATGGGDAGGVGAPITVTMRYVSLLDALKIVTDVAGMKYRVKGSIVMIMPSNMADEDIITRSYNVLPTLTERIMGASRDIGRSSEGDSGWMTTTTDMTEKQDWKEFFRQMGVQWPDGSAISYMATIGKLRVSNTAENLAIFEQVLEELNVTPRQIEIEARFVEVAQEDLNSLGFEWSLNGDAYIGKGTISSLLGTSAAAGLGANRPVPQQAIDFRNAVKAANPTGWLSKWFDANPLPTATGYPRDADLLIDGGGAMSGVSRNMTKGLRFLSGQGLTEGGMPTDDGVVKVTGAISGRELSMILHALSQRSNTDLLSAPKVVTKSGQEAIMKVVQEYIYPTEFTVQTLQSANAASTSTTTGAAVEPGGFETREVGVILQVVPEVSAEGQMINLIMNPQVVSEPTWKDYGYDMPNPNGGDPIHLPMEQPFFKVRSVSTSISIYNGATVVMGGMITEVRRTHNDKIPFLGDIPYIGRLFRNDAELSEKRNLLIFVTARLVDPAGRAVKTSGEPVIASDMQKKLEESITP